jgi:hypothetical protein
MWARQISPATGKVYKLTQLSDFAGNYVAAGAGITVAGGGTALYLEDEHGVVIKLLSTEVGLKFKLSADGQGGGAGWRPRPRGSRLCGDAGETTGLECQDHE